MKNNEVMAQGFTQAYGGAHAEAQALTHLTGTLTGVTAYVTLEPCSFVGKTPSCANTLIERGISRVVVALKDPHPPNNGKGIAMLIQQGVSVDVGVLEQEVKRFIQPHLLVSESIRTS